MKRSIAVLLLAALMTAGFTAQATEFNLKDYTVFTFGERQLVYQGPGETYYRNGNAACGISNNARLYGTLDGCLCIGYGYSTDKFRVGWVRTPEGAKDKRTVLKQSDTVGELRFDMVLRTTVDECAATYDPVKISMRSIEVKKGATVNVLCWYDKWAYCEFKIDKKLSWAFVYADMISKDPVAKPAPDLRTNGSEMKSVLKEIAAKTPAGNYGLFTGPGENYYRAEGGGAHIRPTEKCRVYGIEGDWAFVRVDAESGVRYGYLPAAIVPDHNKFKNISYDCVSSVITEACVLRDAPDGSGEALTELPAGAEVNFLTWSDSGKKSAFIEYKTDSLRVRGFVPAEALSAAKR